jgi:hypothetical protein
MDLNDIHGCVPARYTIAPYAAARIAGPATLPHTHTDTHAHICARTTDTGPRRDHLCPISSHYMLIRCDECNA